MRIETITVSYGMTQSLPKYSNVKPSITLTGVLAEGEDREQAKAALLDEARAFVHEAIDVALEASDRPAKYSAEPRYEVRRTTSYYDHDRPRGQRAAEALGDNPGYTLLDVTDGDLSRLPAWLTTPPAAAEPEREPVSAGYDPDYEEYEPDDDEED